LWEQVYTFKNFPPRKDFDTFCIGIEGTWTAYQLVRDSPVPSVLLVERFQLPHTRGSSHGQSRVIRHSYAEPFHTALMPTAFAEWRQLELDSNTTLLTCVQLTMWQREKFKMCEL
jgi:glycine/D-amino acid oxidase-like deaminating enzyme